jgi:hypothetical protein
MPWAPGAPLELDGGVSYWLVAEADWYDVFWHWSDPPEASDDDLACNGIACNNPGPGSWGLIDRTRPAFRITGTVIPEPATGLLLGLGLALLAGPATGGLRGILRRPLAPT